MSTLKSEEQQFCAWKKAVSQLILKQFDLTLDDLPDMNTRDAFDNGVTPEEFYSDDVLPLMRKEFGAVIDDLLACEPEELEP